MVDCFKCISIIQLYIIINNSNNLEEIILTLEENNFIFNIIINNFNLITFNIL